MGRKRTRQEVTMASRTLCPSLMRWFASISLPAMQTIYGSLGAVMVLLTWLYVTGVMLLLGAEVNMVIEVAAVPSHAVSREDQKANFSEDSPPNTDETLSDLLVLCKALHNRRHDVNSDSSSLSHPGFLLLSSK
jgi:hypothetical protein